MWNSPGKNTGVGCHFLLQENIKKTQTKLNNKITEIKTTIEGINDRINEPEKQSSELEDKVAEITQTEQKK